MSEEIRFDQRLQFDLGDIDRDYLRKVKYEGYVMNFEYYARKVISERIEKLKNKYHVGDRTTEEYNPDTHTIWVSVLGKSKTEDEIYSDNVLSFIGHLRLQA